MLYPDPRDDSRFEPVRTLPRNVEETQITIGFVAGAIMFLVAVRVASLLLGELHLFSSMQEHAAMAGVGVAMLAAAAHRVRAHRAVAVPCEE